MFSISTVALASSSSSSIQIAEVIKTMDMSLPTYADIKDSKASAANVKSLTVPPEQGGGVSVARTKKKGIPASSVLPSMGKKGPKQKPSTDSSGYIL